MNADTFASSRRGFRWSTVLVLLCAVPAAAQVRRSLPDEAPDAGGGAVLDYPTQPGWSDSCRGPGFVLDQVEILAPVPTGFTTYASALAPAGDLDGDGVVDLVAGAPGSFVPGGEAFVYFMERDGSVRASQTIPDPKGEVGRQFGAAVACLGDLDGDSVPDLAVGAPLEGQSGALHVLFMNPDGTVRSSRMKKEGVREGRTGEALGVADFDGDGTLELVAGLPEYAKNNRTTGGLQVHFLEPDGSSSSKFFIGQNEGGFGSLLETRAEFGAAVAGIGDLDGDGVDDLAVGATGVGAGEVWLLFMQADGTVRDERRILPSPAWYPDGLADGDRFGASVASVGDLDGDGVQDLAVGVPGLEVLADVSGTLERRAAGGVSLLFLTRAGDVRAQRLIAYEQGGFAGELELYGGFGGGLAFPGDLNGDGVADLVVGEPKEVPLLVTGSAWVLFLDGLTTLGFETEDDLFTPLRNGQGLNGTDDLGRVVEIDGFPTAGPSAAVFDSSVQGPNALGSDPDLLVGRGNLLILQEHGFLDSDGLYGPPDDDLLGGDFVITFAGREVTPRSLDLVDICPAPNEGATVALTDRNGRTRTFVVPAGWTRDVALDGSPGVRTLDLTTTDDQPGFVATATASQEAGFLPGAVVLVDVHLASSGAIDNVVFDPHPCATTHAVRDTSSGGMPSLELEGGLK